MPYVNVKVVKQQVTAEQKKLLIEGVMDIIVSIMKRNPALTVVVLDEIDQDNWFIAGKPVSEGVHEKFSYIEIRISKGTSNIKQMDEVIKAGKALTARVLGSSDRTNYVIINELNPEAWGFDGLSMYVRNQMDQPQTI